MNLCGVARSLTDLAFDALEAVFYLFDSDKAADELWYGDRLVEKEAEEEVSEPACTCSDTFIPGVHRFNCATDQSSSAAPPSAAAGDRPEESPSPSRLDVETPPGTPPLTRDDLLSASIAADFFADHCTTDEAFAKWRRLAVKLNDAAK